jgi:hypothetical protein
VPTPPVGTAVLVDGLFGAPIPDGSGSVKRCDPGAVGVATVGFSGFVATEAADRDELTGGWLAGGVRGDVIVFDVGYVVGDRNVDACISEHRGVSYAAAPIISAAVAASVTAAVNVGVTARKTEPSSATVTTTTARAAMRILQIPAVH